MADDAAAEVFVPERTSIPSGDDSVWADVSPLLESACKGSFLLALTPLFLSRFPSLFVSRESCDYICFVFFLKSITQGDSSVCVIRNNGVFDWLLRKMED